MTDDRPPSYQTGLFSAFLVRGGSADLKIESIVTVKEMRSDLLGSKFWGCSGEKRSRPGPSRCQVANKLRPLAIIPDEMACFVVLSLSHNICLAANKTWYGRDPLTVAAGQSGRGPAS